MKVNNLPTPLAFLWSELDGLLSDATLAELRQRYNAHKRAYDRAAKIRQAERRLWNLEQWKPTPRRERMMERCRARIKTLQDEENVIA